VAHQPRLPFSILNASQYCAIRQQSGSQCVDGLDDYLRDYFERFDYVIRKRACYPNIFMERLAFNNFNRLGYFFLVKQKTYTDIDLMRLVFGGKRCP
jgi:hypothetical protein